MPTYEYECPSCGARLEERRAIVDREVAAACPCGGHATLVISMPASRFPGADKWRTVMKSRGEGM